MDKRKGDMGDQEGAEYDPHPIGQSGEHDNPHGGPNPPGPGPSPDPKPGNPPPPGPGPAPQPCPPPSIPDAFDQPALTRTLAVRLAGSAADGSLLRGDPPPQVVWVDAGDEVLVHLDSTQVRILDRLLLVSVDLETDQTGRSPLVVALALGGPNDPAGLVATTDDLPRGHPLLAARWGQILQDAVWASLLGLAQDHAAERNSAPRGIHISTGQLQLEAGTPLAAAIKGGLL